MEPPKPKSRIAGRLQKVPLSKQSRGDVVVEYEDYGDEEESMEDVVEYEDEEVDTKISEIQPVTLQFRFSRSYTKQ